MNLKDLWYTAEQNALKFTQQPSIQKAGEITIKIAYTIILLVLCVSVYTYLVAKSLFEMLQDRFKPSEVEDQVTEVTEEDYNPNPKAETDEPDVIKRLRRHGI